VTSMRSGPIIC